MLWHNETAHSRANKHCCNSMSRQLCQRDSIYDRQEGHFDEYRSGHRSTSPVTLACTRGVSTLSELYKLLSQCLSGRLHPLT